MRDREASTWQRIWRQLPKYARLFVGPIVFLASVAGTEMVDRMAKLETRHYAVCVVLALAGFVMVPLGIQLCRFLLVRWSQLMDGFIENFTEAEKRRWIEELLAVFNFSRAKPSAGIVLGVAALLAFRAGGIVNGLALLSATWLLAIVAFAAFMAGWGLCIMVSVAKAIFDLGNAYRGRILVTQGRFGITTTGRVLAQCWIVIGIVWFAFTLSALIGREPQGLWDFLRSYPVLLLAAPTMPLIIGCFVLSQLSLHYAMLAFKRREIEGIEKLLSEATPKEVAGFTKEKREAIELLERQLAGAENLPEWPFSSKAIAGVGGAAITAIFPVILPAIVEGIFSRKLPSLFV